MDYDTLPSGNPLKDLITDEDENSLSTILPSQSDVADFQNQEQIYISSHTYNSENEIIIDSRDNEDNQYGESETVDEISMAPEPQNHEIAQFFKNPFLPDLGDNSDLSEGNLDSDGGNGEFNCDDFEFDGN